MAGAEVAIAARNLALLAEAQRFSEALATAGVGHAFFKGAAFLVTRGEATLANRACDDVDVWVDRGGAAAVAAWAAAVGARPGPIGAQSRTWWVPRGRGAVPVEVHWRVFRPSLFFADSLQIPRRILRANMVAAVAGSCWLPVFASPLHRAICEAHAFLHGGGLPWEEDLRRFAPLPLPAGLPPGYRWLRARQEAGQPWLLPSVWQRHLAYGWAVFGPARLPARLFDGLLPPWRHLRRLAGPGGIARLFGRRLLRWLEW